MKIYIAGPFFTKEERTELEAMIAEVKNLLPEAELFIPMKHFIPDGENMSNEDWGKAVFEMDVKALSESDMMIAMYLGHYSDTGTAWEIGYAFAKNIPVGLYIPPTYRDKDVSIMPINSSQIAQFNSNYKLLDLNQK